MDGRHRQRTVEARGDLPITVGFARYMCGLPPRFAEKSAGIGAHHPGCSDDTIIFGLTWDDIYAVTKAPAHRQVTPRRKPVTAPHKRVKRLAKALAVTGRYALQ